MRVVCLLLIPAVLLTQWVSLGHSHGGSQPVGHAFRPHFHTTSTSAGHHHHDHGHHHHNPGSRHHHDENEASSPATFFTGEHGPLWAHDFDAVFLVAVQVIVGERARVGDELVRSTSWINPELLAFASRWNSLSSQSSLWSHPPPLAFAPDRPLYLRHLALLI
jgi:hypothetical protein